jgi:DNA-binding GntR family transcriptional regulator
VAPELTDLSVIRLAGSGKVRRITADYVGEAVREAILSGRLADGAILSQAAIAERLGVSRVPVREAMRELQAEGLIESRAHHVAVVRGFSLKRIGELYDYRALLEGHMIRRGVAGMAPTVIEKMRLKNEEMLAVDDHSEWLRLNGQFHELALRYGGDETGLELVDMLRQRGERYARMWRGGFGVHEPEAVAAEHRRMIEAIEKGDAAAAGRAVELHIRHTGERLLASGRAHIEAEELPASKSEARTGSKAD